MLYGLSRLQSDPNTYKKYFKMGNFYVDEKKAVKATKHTWNWIKDNRTKYSILRNINRWHELEGTGIEGQIAAPLWDEYYITTDGAVLKNYYPVSINEGKVDLIKDGGERRYYVSDLLYFAFIDNNYDPNIKETKFNNFKGMKPTLDSVMLKDRYVAKLEEKRKGIAAKETQNEDALDKPQTFTTSSSSKNNITEVSISRKEEPEQEFDPLARWDQGV